MEITKDTRVGDILDRYGDIAEVMETFGVRRIGRWDVRRVLARALTVERAAKLHGVPLETFLAKLRDAVRTCDARREVES